MELHTRSSRAMQLSLAAARAVVGVLDDASDAPEESVVDDYPTEYREQPPIMSGACDAELAGDPREIASLFDCEASSPNSVMATSRRMAATVLPPAGATSDCVEAPTPFLRRRLSRERTHAQEHWPWPCETESHARVRL